MIKNKNQSGDTQGCFRIRKETRVFNDLSWDDCTMVRLYEHQLENWQEIDHQSIDICVRTGWKSETLKLSELDRPASTASHTFPAQLNASPVYLWQLISEPVEITVVNLTWFGHDWKVKYNHAYCQLNANAWEPAAVFPNHPVLVLASRCLE